MQKCSSQNIHKIQLTTFLHMFLVRAKEPLAQYHSQRGRWHQTRSGTSKPQENGMSYTAEERIAECYRRADEYQRLHKAASNLGERRVYLSARRDFLRLAMNLKKTLAVPKKRGAG